MVYFFLTEHALHLGLWVCLVESWLRRRWYIFSNRTRPILWPLSLFSCKLFKEEMDIFFLFLIMISMINKEWNLYNMQFHQLGPNFRTLVWIRTFLSRMVWKMLINYKFLEFSTPYLQKWYDTRGIQSWSKSYIGSSRQVIDVNINHLSLFDGMLVKGGCIFFLILTDQAFKASAPWMVTTCLKNWPFLGQKMLFWGQIYHFPLRSCLSAPYLLK